MATSDEHSPKRRAKAVVPPGIAAAAGSQIFDLDHHSEPAGTPVDADGDGWADATGFDLDSDGVVDSVVPVDATADIGDATSSEASFDLDQGAVGADAGATTGANDVPADESGIDAADQLPHDAHVDISQADVNEAYHDMDNMQHFDAGMHASYDALDMDV